MKLEGNRRLRPNPADVVQADIISAAKQPNLPGFRRFAAAFCTTPPKRECILQAVFKARPKGCAKGYGFLGCGAGEVRRAAAIAPIPPASNASINSVLNRLVGRK